MSPWATTGPCPKQLYVNRLWHCYMLHLIIQTVHWDCRQCTSLKQITTLLAASWQRKKVWHEKKKNKSFTVVIRLYSASMIALLIAGMKRCTSRWHNTPQASICAQEDIMSASPVVSTRIYNIYRGSANIMLPVNHSLLKYGLQNQFTYRSLCLTPTAVRHSKWV